MTFGSDEEVLQHLGYRQQLHRGWRAFTNVSITINSMSVLLSVTSSFGTGLLYGGPVVCLWGWLLVCFLSICQGLGMSELASSMPTSGGMYYWMFQLIGPSFWGRLTCWVVGWLNLLGQIAGLASTHFVMANIIATMILLNTGTAAGDGLGVVLTNNQMVGLYAGCLALTAFCNSISYENVTYLTEFGAVWHTLGAAIVIIVIPCIATQHQPASYVFKTFETQTVSDNYGIQNRLYIFLLGLLFPAWSFTGYDGATHMSEETKDASMSGPIGIMAGMAFMTVAGFLMNTSLLFSTSDPMYVLGYADDGNNGTITPEANGDLVPQIFWDAFQQRTGNGTRGAGFLIIMLGGCFFCAHSSTTYIARIMFAYSRDKAVPFASIWVKYNERTQSPMYAVWGACFAAFCLGLTMLGSSAAFFGIASLSTISLNIAATAPIFVRITTGRKRFKPGPFCLGWWAYPIGVIACMWVALITIVFSLPSEYPAKADSLNYAGVALGCTIVLSLLWFCFPVIGAHAWFEGPVRTVIDDEIVTHDLSPDISIHGASASVLSPSEGRGLSLTARLPPWVATSGWGAKFLGSGTSQLSAHLHRLSKPGSSELSNQLHRSQIAGSEDEARGSARGHGTGGDGTGDNSLEIGTGRDSNSTGGLRSGSLYTAGEGRRSRPSRVSSPSRASPLRDSGVCGAQMPFRVSPTLASGADTSLREGLNPVVEAGVGSGGSDAGGHEGVVVEGQEQCLDVEKERGGGENGVGAGLDANIAGNGQRQLLKYVTGPGGELQGAAGTASFGRWVGQQLLNLGGGGVHEEGGRSIGRGRSFTDSAAGGQVTEGSLMSHKQGAGSSAGISAEAVYIGQTRARGRGGSDGQYVLMVNNKLYEGQRLRKPSEAGDAV